MTKRRHKENTKTFNELTYEEQAKSINAQISTLGKAIMAHVRKAEQENRSFRNTLCKCIGQVSRLVTRLCNKMEEE